MSFRSTLIWLNVIVLAILAGIVIWRVMSLRRNPERTRPANVTPFLADEDLEGRHLERVLGWALLFTLVIAVTLPVYFLIEPSRQTKAVDAFDERAVERGAVLFASAQSKSYDSTRSLLCANCHGVDAKGGAAQFVLQPEAEICLKKENQNNPDVPECLPKQVAWRAPALDNVLLRYDEDQVRNILIYGRPGTPMPAWGVASGKGVLNEQGIDDLLAYLTSIQISSADAKARSTKDIAAFKKEAADAVTAKSKEVDAARQALAEASGPVAEAEAAKELEALEAQLVSVRAWERDVDQMNEGEILFRLNCARCHTRGWSYYDPARTDVPPPAPMGSGAFGPSLRDGSTRIQFPGRSGRDQMFDWVAVGVPANNQYGVRGISSGRMPHFGKLLTQKQIYAIIDYERSL